jgi:hypothetical protein
MYNEKRGNMDIEELVEKLVVQKQELAHQLEVLGALVSYATAEWDLPQTVDAAVLAAARPVTIKATDKGFEIDRG